MEQLAPIHVVGGGLAGSEAAWQIAEAGVPVVLHEMRPVVATFAHKTGGLAELVCSNSFRSDDWENNAVGLLHEEMRRAGSLILAAGDRHKLPAGGALAVDRDNFSADVTERLQSHPLVSIERDEVAGMPPAAWDSVVVATKGYGPTGPGANAKGASRLHLIDACKASLKRLQLDHIDLYQIHGFDPATPIEEQVRALDILVQHGHVRYVGVSNWAAWQVVKALGISAQAGLVPLTSQ